MITDFESQAVSNAVLTVSALSVPAEATMVEIQADDASGIRYTLDGSTNPTVDVGFLLAAGGTKVLLIEDLRNIRFIRDGGSDTTLFLHYFSGRDI